MNGRPRLLVAVTHPITANVLMRGQLRALVAAGFEVGVASAPGPDLAAVAGREGVAAFRVPFSRAPAPFRDVAALVSMVSVLRRFRPDLVNSGTPKAGLIGTLAARLTGIGQRVYTMRGLRLETVAGPGRRLLAAAERATAACATRTVCVSESLRRAFLDITGANPADVVVLGRGSSNGVDLDRFDPTRRGGAEAARLRGELGLPADAPVVGYVGRLTRDKGIDDLVAVVRDGIRPRHPGARLLVVGALEKGDPIAPHTARAIASEPWVTTTGWVDDPAPYYPVMDLLAFPSYREGLPNAPLEASASATPVVGYAATGTVDAVVDGVGGRVVPVGDRAALSEAISGLLADPESRRSYGAAARAFVEASFKREDVWRRWVDFYRGELRLAGWEAPGTATGERA